MRLSANTRIKVASRAEKALQRFAHPDPKTGIRPHKLWHKHVHNVELDDVQALKMIQMDQHRDTVDFSCRRTRKTSTKELYNLEVLATREDESLGIVAPRERQSQNNLKYIVDAIRRSQMLQDYIAYRAGRKQLSDTKLEFHNRSTAQTYGIMGEIDGDSLSIASLEEVDDMPEDRLLSRFLPMLGAAQRLGSAKKLQPQTRISGVFKGAGVLASLLSSGEYHTLPTVDVYLGMRMGIIDEAWVKSQRTLQTGPEWLRQFMCVNIAATNHIWEKHITRARAVGISAGLDWRPPMPGQRYKKRGVIAFGYDHTGHGESTVASKSALVVVELIGSYAVFRFVKTWAAGTDDKIIEMDLLGFWDYFRPDYAMGDAFGVGMLTSLNDRLYAQGLTDVDRRTIGDGDSTASTWASWPFAPIRFQGFVKHSMASMLRAVFHNGQAAIPAFEDDDPEAEDCRLLVQQLGNIRAEKTKADYDSYVMVEEKIGDDLFDAAMAAVWALVTRGEIQEPTVVLSRTQSREQLLGLAGGLVLPALEVAA